jgi:hypothetical protein
MSLGCILTPIPQQAGVVSRRDHLLLRPLAQQPNVKSARRFTKEGYGLRSARTRCGLSYEPHLDQIAQRLAQRATRCERESEPIRMACTMGLRNSTSTSRNGQGADICFHPWRNLAEWIGQSIRISAEMRVGPTASVANTPEEATRPVDVRTNERTPGQRDLPASYPGQPKMNSSR